MLHLIIVGDISHTDVSNLVFHVYIICVGATWESEGCNYSIVDKIRKNPDFIRTFFLITNLNWPLWCGQ